MNQLRTLALALLAALGCGGPATPTPQTPRGPGDSVRAEAQRPVGLDRPPTPREQSAIRRLMRVTERIRGLRFRSEVNVRIQDREAMRAFVRRELQDDELDRARLRYVALGMIAPDLALRPLLEQVMEEQLVGYYDPRHKHFAIRDDVAAAFGRARARSAPHSGNSDLEWQATVVHELVHALQDQHFGIGDQLERDRNTDESNAFAALVEGDATLAMLAYVADAGGVPLQRLTDDLPRLRRGLAVQQDGGALAQAPAIVREPLLFRYRDGAVFAASLANTDGFRSVNAAFDAPPRSTQQIMEPSRFRGAEPVPTVELPALPPLRSAGFRELEQDTLGRLELGLYLDHGGSDGPAVASAWRGDRYSVLQRGDQLALIWRLRFGGPSAARRAAALANAGYRDAAVRAGATFTAVQHGAELVIVRNLPPELVDPVLRLLSPGALR